MSIKLYLRLVGVALLAFLLVACGGTATQEALPTEVEFDADTSEETSTDPSASTDTDTEEDTAPSVDLTVELPDVPAGLDGMLLDITGVEGGFSIEDAPVRLQQGMCFTPIQGFLFTDDTTNAPPEVDMNISLIPDITPGTYTLAFNNPNNNPDLVQYSANIYEDNVEDVNQFTRLESGVIRIDSIPTADGETFSGALQVTMSSEGEIIQIDGVFNVTLTGDDLCSA